MLMTDMSAKNQQRGEKIRISIWILVVVAIVIYAGFIYLTILAGVGGVE